MSSNPKRKVKLALFIGAVIVYLENPRDPIKKNLLLLSTTFGKEARYQI